MKELTGKALEAFKTNLAFSFPNSTARSRARIHTKKQEKGNWNTHQIKLWDYIPNANIKKE